MEINFLVLVSTHMDFFFHVKSILSFVADCFFPTMKHPNMTRLAFDRAQVNNMDKVLCNNFDYPKICLFFEIVEWGSE